jgi:hypothetical protein
MDEMAGMLAGCCDGGPALVGDEPAYPAVSMGTQFGCICYGPPDPRTGRGDPLDRPLRCHATAPRHPRAPMGEPFGSPYDASDGPMRRNGYGATGRRANPSTCARLAAAVPTHFGPPDGIIARQEHT